jgi:acyl carrier protein
MGKLYELMGEIDFSYEIQKNGKNRNMANNNSNIKKYKNAFIESFEITEDLLETLEYQSIINWDSVGHMVLIAALEDGFDIMMEMDDIIDFSSFKKGKELLIKYDIIV